MVAGWQASASLGAMTIRAGAGLSRIDGLKVDVEGAE